MNILTAYSVTVSDCKSSKKSVYRLLTIDSPNRHWYAVVSLDIPIKPPRQLRSVPLAAPAQHIAERLLSETSTSWRASVPTPGLQPIARRSDFSHFLAIILHLDLKVDFGLSIDKGRHCAAASSLHSRPAQFAKVCRGHFQLLKQRNEVFAELVLPEDFPERQWPQSQAL